MTFDKPKNFISKLLEQNFWYESHVRLHGDDRLVWAGDTGGHGVGGGGGGHGQPSAALVEGEGRAVVVQHRHTLLGRLLLGWLRGLL